MAGGYGIIDEALGVGYLSPFLFRATRAACVDGAGKLPTVGGMEAVIVKDVMTFL